MAVALGQSEFYVYENGVTALNFPKRAEAINARASRTAHPRTLRLLQHLFRLVGGGPFEIKAPFAFKTKSDVLAILRERGRLRLLNSAVSCSRTFKVLGAATHCGECSQCIDRRFAAYATACEAEDDASGYAFDFVNESVASGETRSALIDYLRQAWHFLSGGIGNFQSRLQAELSDAVDLDVNEVEQLEAIYTMCHRHGEQIKTASARMVAPLTDYPDGSLKTLLYGTDFSRPPVYALAHQVSAELERFIRLSFSKERPKDENDLNAKINGFLSAHKERFMNEHPCIRFAGARTVPDHTNSTNDLLIESKYVRKSTSPSVATGGIAEDLTKYPDESLKLFIVYDPEGAIADRAAFKRDYEQKRRCLIHVV